MSVVVAQLGARMHYAVPRLLDRGGLLERLYTDFCAGSGWPRALNLLPPGLRPARVQRLLGRAPAGIPSQRITSFSTFGIRYARRCARARSTDERNAAYLWAGRSFCELVVRNGFGKANTVYAFNSAALEILQAARARGIRGIVEQTIAPREIEQRILAEETGRFPQWEPPVREGATMREYCSREVGEWHAADLVICGSEFVREGVVACGGNAEKCVVIPYGIEIDRMTARPSPRRPGPLRVLTVGSVCLRKGAPYVLAAARDLRGQAEFRFTGAIQILPAAEKEMRGHVDLPGVIARSEMASQYAWADVFLLPSLCEGSATATYEAMGYGLPVICTRETGSTVKEGENGFIVRSRDAAAIAARLRVLAENAELLATMSKAAFRSGADYSLEHYGNRLLPVLRERRIVEA
jgi:glycosyltransferase involved in cell wall biosynthesis